MNDVKDISPIGSELNPDLRVNYESGLVLSVNEFRQEQQYFLEKNYLYSRVLHGFGTVSGLNVTVQPSGGNSQDWTVTIEPGIAIDQWGRSIVVRDNLCAHLQAWLTKQDADVTTHLDNDGNGHIYVVASYRTYTEALVPVPGLGCDSGIAQAASRIHDSYTIELTWTKPEPPAWDAEWSFARLLSQIQIVPGDTNSDEQKIIDYIQQLDQPDSVPPSSFQLPALHAREALDRIVATWITRMRPKMHTNLFNQESSTAVDNPAILLTTIDLQLQQGKAPDTSWHILSEPSPPRSNDAGRPVLMNTQLVQETILQGQRSAGAVDSSAITHPFVTVTVLSISPLKFELWFHLNPDQGGNEVFIQDASPCFVTIERGGNNVSTQPVDCAVASGTERNVFVLTPNIDDLTPPAYLRLIFPVDQLKVQLPSDKSISLREYVQGENIRYEGYNGSDAIIAYVRAPSSCVSVI